MRKYFFFRYFELEIRVTSKYNKKKILKQIYLSESAHRMHKGKKKKQIKIHLVKEGYYGCEYKSIFKAKDLELN